MSKSHKLPFSENSLVSNKPLQLVYSDVWGPTQKSIDGYAYYVTFIDHYSKYVWLYPMKQKSDTHDLFIHFQKLVENYFHTRIVSVFTDNGGEYQKLKNHFLSCGISHYTTPPHTPEHNGTAERRHRSIVETGLAMLQFSSLPSNYWSHAFQAAVYLLNRLPSSAISFQTPFSRLFGMSHNFKRLKSFGCLCFPWLRPYNNSKLQCHSLPCIFFGYSPTQSAYKCYDPKANRLYLSRHVQFVEHIFPSETCTSSHQFTDYFRDASCTGSAQQQNSSPVAPTVVASVPLAISIPSDSDLF